MTTLNLKSIEFLIHDNSMIINSRSMIWIVENAYTYIQILVEAHGGAFFLHLLVLELVACRLCKRLSYSSIFIANDSNLILNYEVLFSCIYGIMES